MSKPPRERNASAKTRIKKGEIRNPWGRPGKPKPRIDFLDVEVPISLNGQSMRLTRDDAVDHVLFGLLSKGNVSAARLLIQRRKERLIDGKGAEDTPEGQRESDEARQFLVDLWLQKKGTAAPNTSDVDPDHNDEEEDPVVCPLRSGPP